MFKAIATTTLVAAAVLTAAPALAAVGATPAAYDAAAVGTTKHDVQQLFQARGCRFLETGDTLQKVYPTDAAGEWVGVTYQRSGGHYRLVSKFWVADSQVDVAACFR